MSVIGPWGFDSKSKANEQCDSHSSDAGSQNSFDDNFVDNDSIDKRLSIPTAAKVIEKKEQPTSAFEPLTDSREYLDRLEFKLRKVQDVSLQKALSERRSDEARRLLDARLIGPENSGLSSDSQLEPHIVESVEDNPILRRLCPERQAVNLSELQKLIEKDNLQKLVEELGECEIEPEQSQHKQNCVIQIDVKDGCLPESEKNEPENVSANQKQTVDQEKGTEKSS